MAPRGNEGPLATLTHAQIRASQGDRGAARRILQEILSGQPDHPEALALLDSLSSGKGPGAAASSGPAPPDRVVGELERWLERIRKNAVHVRTG